MPVASTGASTASPPAPRDRAAQSQHDNGAKDIHVRGRLAASKGERGVSVPARRLRTMQRTSHAWASCTLAPLNVSQFSSARLSWSRSPPITPSGNSYSSAAEHRGEETQPEKRERARPSGRVTWFSSSLTDLTYSSCTYDFSSIPSCGLKTCEDACGMCRCLTPFSLRYDTEGVSEPSDCRHTGTPSEGKRGLRARGTSVAHHGRRCEGGQRGRADRRLLRAAHLHHQVLRHPRTHVSVLCTIGGTHS